jgi:hypothetical protein
MIVEEITKDKITISFSGSVGKKGLALIRDYIEFLEKSGTSRRKKVSQSVISPKKGITKKQIQELADEINEAAWKKFKKARGIE